MKNIYILISFLIVLTGCRVVEFDPELDNLNENILVVEALITDVSEMQYVKLHRTTAYMSEEEPESVNNAVVDVSDGNQVYPFMNSGNGIYNAPTGFNGEIGKTYRLKISLEGEVYEAESKMLPAFAFDSLEILKDDLFGSEQYVINCVITENLSNPDYVLSIYAQNGVLNDSLANRTLFTVENLNGQTIEGYLFMGIEGNTGDKITVYTYSVDEEYLQFYNAAAASLMPPNPFMPPPGASVKGNISNGALGFFQISAVWEEDLFIP